MLKNSNTGLFVMCDVIALCVAFVCALNLAPFLSEILYSIFELSGEQGVVKFEEVALSYWLLCGGLLFALYNKGYYRVRIPWWNQVGFILKCCFICLLIDGFMHFAFKDASSRMLILLSWMLVYFFLLIGRQAARILAIRKGAWIVDSVVIGDAESVTDILFSLASGGYCGYNVSTLLLRGTAVDKFDRETLPLVYRDIKIIDGGDDYVGYAQTHTHKFFVIALDGFRGKVRDDMMDTMRRYGIDHVIVPPTRRVSLYGMEPQYFFGHDVMFLRHRPMVRTPMGRMLKRVLDIFGAVCGLLVLALPLLLLMLFVRKDGGAAFYGGQRIGRDGRPFACWKFRSMCVDAAERLEKLLAEDEDARKEFEATFKLKDDPRVTKIGGVMRRTSLDELPQLWNVLKGEMSLVGPRPVPQKELETYTAEGYRAYKMVKPGITGLWQVSGRSDTSYEQRIRYDIWYVRNWSLWHDIVIILKTIKVVIFRSGAY